MHEREAAAYTDKRQWQVRAAELLHWCNAQMKRKSKQDLWVERGEGEKHTQVRRGGQGGEAPCTDTE